MNGKPWADGSVRLSLRTGLRDRMGLIWARNIGPISLQATPHPFSLDPGVRARSRSFLTFQHLAHGPELLVAFFEQEFL
jgi:hypothetical protein